MNSCGQNYATVLIFLSFFDRIQTNARNFKIDFLLEHES